MSCEGERVVESSNRWRSEGWGCLENAFGGFFGVGGDENIVDAVLSPL